VLLVAAGIGAWWFVTAGYPDYEQDLSVDGLSEEVEILRDDRAVAHIRASNSDDLILRPGVRSRAGAALADGLPAARGGGVHHLSPLKRTAKLPARTPLRIHVLRTRHPGANLTVRFGVIQQSTR